MNTFQLWNMSLQGVSTLIKPTKTKNAKKSMTKSQIWHPSKNSDLQANETPNHDIFTYPLSLAWRQSTHKVSSSFDTSLTQNQASDTVTYINMCQKMCDNSSYHPILYGRAFQMPKYGEKMSFLRVVMTLGRFLHSHALNDTHSGVNQT